MGYGLKNLATFVAPELDQGKFCMNPQPLYLGIFKHLQAMVSCEYSLESIHWDGVGLKIASPKFHLFPSGSQKIPRAKIISLVDRQSVIPGGSGSVGRSGPHLRHHPGQNQEPFRAARSAVKNWGSLKFILGNTFSPPFVWRYLLGYSHQSDTWVFPKMLDLHGFNHI